MVSILLFVYKAYKVFIRQLHVNGTACSALSFRGESESLSEAQDATGNQFVDAVSDWLWFMSSHSDWQSCLCLFYDCEPNLGKAWHLVLLGYRIQHSEGCIYRFGTFLLKIGMV